MIGYIHAAEVAIEQIAAGRGTADQKESPTLDFKEERGSSGDLEKIVAAAAICFANSAGGVIVVGVADKGTGAAALTGTQLSPEKVRQRVYELTQPHLNVDVQRYAKFPSVLLVLVPQSPELHSDMQGRATERVNRDCLPMSPDRQARVREERRGIDWSADRGMVGIDQVLPEAIAAARKILGAFTDARRQLAALAPADLLSALGALAADRRGLNRAGALMFCGPVKGLPSSLLYQYRLTPGGEPASVQRLEAPLVLAFGRIMELIEARQTLTPITLASGQQITIENFPALAVREALSNAICHRDYHLTDPVVIDHSPEVLSITSPGPLVAGVTASNIITTTSRPRNPALAKVARTLGLAEELGRGVDRMYREMIRSGREVPEIQSQYGSVRVAFVGGAPNTTIARFAAQLPEAERDDTDTMLILFQLCRQRTVNAASIASWLQRTHQEAEVILRRLASDSVGLLERTRATAQRTLPSYRLRAEALSGLGSAVEYNRRTTDDVDRKVIAHVREYGKITNRTLQNFFDVGVFKARDIIADLVARGILTRISEQARGPKVEWGPGPQFPVAKKRATPGQPKG